jgi:hypothetical protein
MDKFEVKADSGALMATQSKKSDKSPDYWGEIAINVKDLSNVQSVNGFLVFKLSGWKKRSKSGNTYLSLAVNRREANEVTRKPVEDEEPF